MTGDYLGGRFDHLYLIRAIWALDHYNLETLNRGLGFISVRVQDRQNKTLLTLLDSYAFMNSKLSSLSDRFFLNEDKFTKGHFPFLFLKQSTLNYQGSFPALHFYESFNDTYAMKVEKTKWWEAQQGKLFRMHDELVR